MIPAQLTGLVTNWVVFWKQRGTRLGWRDKDESLVWKSERQEAEVVALGSWNMEVCLRCWARPMPKRLRRVMQQCLPFGSRQREVSHGKVST